MKGEGGRGVKGVLLLHCCLGITADEPVGRDQGGRQREDETKGREGPKSVKPKARDPAPPANHHRSCMSECESGLSTSLNRDQGH